MKNIVEMKNQYVQYGCAWSAPRSWINFDASPTLRFEKIPILGSIYTKNATRFPNNVVYGDIVKGLPLEKKSCAGVYASHVLEHLALDDLKVALRNTYDLLVPGGIFRLVVPDLRVLAQSYLESEDPLASLEFMRATSLGVVARPRGVLGMLKIWLGNSTHLWMWDYPSLSIELSNVGFSHIRKCEFGDSEDPCFKDVEEIGRFDNAVAIEARK